MLKGARLSVTDAKKRLHVQTPEGEMKVGIDAFLALWAQMPIYRYLGRLVAIPVIYHVAVLVYNHILAPLLHWWDKRRIQREEAANR